MRLKNDVLRAKILDALCQYLQQKGHSPSMQELADALQVNISTISRNVKAMVDEGTVLKDGIRGLSTPEWQRKQQEPVPIEGARRAELRMVPKNAFIACGPSQEVETIVEDYIPIPEVMLDSREEYYILTAVGESMIEAGIAEGDQVLICRTTECRPKDIVVALIETGTTLKRYLVTDDEARRPFLHPENRTMADIYPEKLEIQGVMVGLYRPYKRH